MMEKYGPIQRVITFPAPDMVGTGAKECSADSILNSIDKYFSWLLGSQALFGQSMRQSIGFIRFILASPLLDLPKQIAPS